jgi:SH3-like domain-containing protein
MTPTAAPSMTHKPAALPSMTTTESPSMTSMTASPDADWTASIELPTVNVRAKPSGKVIGTLKAGQTVTILSCDGSWCLIAKPRGYVFRGCLSDNPKNLGCQAK